MNFRWGLNGEIQVTFFLRDIRPPPTIINVQAYPQELRTEIKVFPLFLNLYRNDKVKARRMPRLKVWEGSRSPREQDAQRLHSVTGPQGGAGLGQGLGYGCGLGSLEGDSRP